MSLEPTVLPVDVRSGIKSVIASAGTIRLLLAYLLLGGLALSPLFFVSVPSLVDYPNHLARMWVLAHPSAASSQNYVPHWQLLPTLAMDLVVPALAQLMPIELAGRLFIGLTLALLVLGTVALHRVLWGRVGLWPLCSLLFLYNVAFYGGLLNYLFGLGLALLAFAAWIATAHWAVRPRILAFSLVASLLFILHLFAFGVYGLLLAAYELGNCWRRRRWTRDDVVATGARFTQFIVPALLWLASLSNGGPRHTSYGSLVDKLQALTAPMTYGEVGLVVVPLCIGLVYLGWRNNALAFAPAMRLPILVLIVAAALMPNWLNGSWGADLRLPIALPFVIIAATRPHLSRGFALGLGIFAVQLLAVRAYALTVNWRDMDHHFTEFRAAAASIPQGARILVVQPPLPDGQHSIAGVPRILVTRQEPDFFHMPALAIIDRGAFIPYLFTGWTIVRPTPRNAGRYQSQGGPVAPEQIADVPDGMSKDMAPNILGELPYWHDWRRKFDYVLWLDFGTAVTQLPRGLEPWASGSFFHIYRISPS